ASERSCSARSQDAHRVPRDGGHPRSNRAQGVIVTRPKKSERVVAPEDLTFVEFLKLIHGSTHILRKWLKEAADKKLTALELLNELDDEVLLDKVETKLAS